MKGREVLQALLDGKRVRKTRWVDKKSFASLEHEENLIKYGMDDFYHDEWEEYIEPKEAWQPKGGKYRVNAVFIEKDIDCVFEQNRFGLDFHTREEAEKAAHYFRFVHRLWHLAREMNEKDKRKPDPNFYWAFVISYEDEPILRIDCMSHDVDDHSRYVIPLIYSQDGAYEALKIIQAHPEEWGLDKDGRPRWI